MVALAVIVAGTIGTYNDLTNKVALWLDRDDLAGEIPDFVALAEARFNRDLRILNQEVSATITTGAPAYAMPSDFRRIKRIWISGQPNRPLTQISGPSAAQTYPWSPGCTLSYYIENRTLHFLPEPNQALTLDCTYLSRITPLTSANQSNWLLEEHPDAYLFGALLEAAVYIRDQDAINYLDGRLTNTLQDINAASRRDSWGSGPIAPQSPRQVRGGRC